MGSGYRKEWVTPIDFPVLDLATFAGGLTPVRQVGVDAEHRPRPRGQGRQELHVPHHGQGPDPDPAAGVGGHRAREALPGRDHGEPPRQRLRRPGAGRGGGRPAHEPAATCSCRTTRRSASSARRSAASRGRSRSSRCPGPNGTPGLRGRGRDPLDGRAVDAQPRGQGAGRRARAPARAALRPLDRGLGPAQQAVALAAARGRPRVRAAARGPRPGLLEVRGPAAGDGAGHAPEVHGLEGPLHELRRLDDAGRRGRPLDALRDGPGRLRGDGRGADGAAAPTR